MNNRKKRLNPKFIPFIAETLKALGHPHRLRLLEALASGEKSVSQLVEDLQLPQAIVSQQLRIMKSGQVVSSQRQGTLAMYRISNPGLYDLLNCLHSCQDHCLPFLSRT